MRCLPKLWLFWPDTTQEKVFPAFLNRFLFSLKSLSVFKNYNIPKMWELGALHPTMLHRYSWIAHQLDIGRMQAFLLWMSDFKSETSFGFRIENYMSHVFWIFPKTSKRACLASFHIFNECFPGFIGFRHSICDWAQNHFLLSQTMYRTCITCVQLCSLCL